VIVCKGRRDGSGWCPGADHGAHVPYAHNLNIIITNVFIIGCSLLDLFSKDNQNLHRDYTQLKIT
jgi:hypothetical protein